MIQDEAYGCGVQADIDAVEHGTAERHAKVGFKVSGHIGCDDRDRVVPVDAAAAQRAGQRPASTQQLGVAVAQIAVDDRSALWKDRRTVAEKISRRQRLIVRLDAVEIGFEGVAHVR